MISVSDFRDSAAKHYAKAIQASMTLTRLADQHPTLSSALSEGSNFRSEDFCTIELGQIVVRSVGFAVYKVIAEQVRQSYGLTEDDLRNVEIKGHTVYSHMWDKTAISVMTTVTYNARDSAEELYFHVDLNFDNTDWQRESVMEDVLHKSVTLELKQQMNRTKK